jgi:hypothetical protein
MKELSYKELIELYKILKDFTDTLKQKLEEKNNDKQN